MASAVQDSIDSILQSACVDGARYRAGDLLGKLLAHISLTPYLVLFYQACIVYNRREIHEAVLLIGALHNIVVGRLLKRAIHQTRPLSTCEALGICTKPGMPSSHAQIVSYAFCIFVFQLLHHQRAVTKDTLQQLGRAVKSIVFLGVSFLVAYSRVYLGYHTILQVAAGAAAGLLMAALWWIITKELCGTEGAEQERMMNF